MTKALDDRDRSLLTLLKEDARIPTAELARRVHLSRSAVQERLARLERDGVIQRYTIEIGADVPAAPIRALVVLKLTAQHCPTIAAAVVDWPEIEACHSLAGALDMAMMVRTATTDRLQDIVTRLAAMETVARVESHLILQTRFER